MALVLILTLLGLGAVDAAVCRGADGHLGFDTRVSSCCRSAAPEVPLTDLVDRIQTTSLDPANGGSTCQDTPLIQGSPTAHVDHLAAGGLGPAITVPYPITVSPTNRGTPLSFCSGSILCRLRSTILLI